MNRLIALSLWTAFAVGCTAIRIPVSGPPAAEMREFVVRPAEGRFTTNKMLLLNITGMITAGEDGGLLGTRRGTYADVRDALAKAEEDERVKALILRIDSRGGEVTASDTIFEEIRRFKNQRRKNNKPVAVFASIGGLGASGGYYVALAADKIYAHPTSITGSIGVVAMFPNLAGLTSMIGVEMRVIKSSEKKDAGSIWRDFTPEERAILQKTIDEMYERFVEVVVESRPQLDREAVLRLADGRIYTGPQAVEAKLIDGIAYLDDVYESAKKAAGIEDAAIVTYRRSPNLMLGIYSKAPAPAPQTDAAPEVNLLRVDGGGVLDSIQRTGFYYMWLP